MEAIYTANVGRGIAIPEGRYSIQIQARLASTQGDPIDRWPQAVPDTQIHPRQLGIGVNAVSCSFA